MHEDEQPIEIEIMEDVPVVLLVHEPITWGIGGWLTIPFVGILVVFFFYFISLFTDVLPIYTEGTWDAQTDRTSDEYHPWFALFLAFASVTHVLLTGYLVVTFWYFAQRSRLIPRLMIIFHSTWFVVNLIGIILLDQSLPSDDTHALWVAKMVFSLFVGLIGIPYFLLSERVKGTFVEDVPRRRKKKT